MRRLKVDVGIVADAADAARSLAAVVAAHARARRALEAIARAKAETAEAIRAKVQPQMSFLDAIREVLPENGILCDEMTQVGYVSWFGFPVYAPRTLITSGFSGTLGAGFPMALGVKVAHPDRPVVALTGDGGFLFGGAELATAVQHGINLTTVLFNNSAYGNVLRDQRRLYEGRDAGAALRNPDFQAYAKSFGVASWRVERCRRPAHGARRGAHGQRADPGRGHDRHRRRKPPPGSSLRPDGDRLGRDRAADGQQIQADTWCCRRGLNSRPLPYQGSALPLSYGS